LLDSKTVQGVFDIVIAKIDDGEFLSFVNEYLDQNTDWIEETLIKEKFVEESVAEFFNVAFENIVSDKKVGKFNKGMRGLDA
jgi:hypothetical protein